MERTIHKKKNTLPTNTLPWPTVPRRAERVQSAVAVLLLYISLSAGIRTNARIHTVVDVGSAVLGYF